MRGAIIGDVVGSPYEHGRGRPLTTGILTPRSRFTDDTVCTVAIADAILNGRPFEESLRDWCGRYPDAGYGGMFRRWLADPTMGPYGSYGNGAPMRVSPCAWLAETPIHAIELAKASCAPTHNHERAVMSAIAVVHAIGLARVLQSKEPVVHVVEHTLGQPIPRVSEVAGRERFEIEADVTVLTATACVLEAETFLDVLQNAVRCGGDVDTIAAIAGSIAEPILPIPETLWNRVATLLPADILAVVAACDRNLAERKGMSDEELGQLLGEWFRHTSSWSSA